MDDREAVRRAHTGLAHTLERIGFDVGHLIAVAWEIWTNDAPDEPLRQPLYVVGGIDVAGSHLARARALVREIARGAETPCPCVTSRVLFLFVRAAAPGGGGRRMGINASKQFGRMSRSRALHEVWPPPEVVLSEYGVTGAERSGLCSSNLAVVGTPSTVSRSPAGCCTGLCRHSP